MKNVRVRFAPSPTGYLHIGGLRTALYNFLYARKNKGIFYLRIEDTDQKRIVEGSLGNLAKSLSWAGIKHDEGVFLSETGKNREVGKLGPYVQSQRIKIYQKYAHELVKNGKAYYCFCSPERLEKLRQDQTQAKIAPQYDKYCLHEVSREEAEKRMKNGDQFVIRFDVPETGETEFEDVVRGKIRFTNKNLDDFVILKSDGFPTYHLAHVVDDYLMKTTLVLRSEEWLPSTPKHLLLAQALGFEAPRYGHLCVILNKDTKRKLSKRDGDVSVKDFWEKGYLPEAVINFIALLGWNPKTEQEIFSMPELIEKFDLAKLNKSAAMFDREKLDWMNGLYIRKKNISELFELCRPFLTKYEKLAPKEFLKKVVTVERERMKTLADVETNIDFYFSPGDYEKQLLVWKNMPSEEIVSALDKAESALAKISATNWKIENIKKSLMEISDSKNRGALLWPVRVALSGKEKSPSPFEIAWVLEKKETLLRIKAAKEKLQK